MNAFLRPKSARVPPCGRARFALDRPPRKYTWRAGLLAVSLLLPALAAAGDAPAAASAGDAPRPARVVALRRSETPDGARFTLTSDSPLDDYRSYAEGERLVVLVPRASLASTRGELAHARGFADMRVEQRPDALLVSFRLQAGATVSVSQNFNRLEVVFLVNEKLARSAPA